MNSIVKYTIMPGDNLYRLSDRFGTTVENILAFNQAIDPYNLIPGTVLFMPNRSRRRTGISQNELNLRNSMRLVWEQHVEWTRMFIISAIGGLGDLKATTDRLMANPGDMARLFAPYYGPAAAAKIKQ